MLMSTYSKLTYRNEVNQELSLSPFSTFWCEKCEETISNQIHLQKQVDTHGKFFTGMSLNERYITLTGFVMHGMDIHNANSTLQIVFNPTIKGTLYFENTALGISRNIECRILSIPSCYWSQKQLKFDINLICPDPFWKGESITEYIAQIVKKFKFETAIPKNGMSFGTRKRTLESKFENAGNVESGFQAFIRAAGGTVINPEIRNEATGEKIKILYTMKKNDVLLITNTLQEKRIEINGINGFKYLDAKNTTFFKIMVGSNRIGYYADENISNMTVHVTYTPYYTHTEVLA